MEKLFKRYLEKAENGLGSVDRHLETIGSCHDQHCDYSGPVNEKSPRWARVALPTLLIGFMELICCIAGKSAMVIFGDLVEKYLRKFADN